MPRPAPHRIRRAPNKRSGGKASLAAQIPVCPGALAPCRDRGAEATATALAHLLDHLPFPQKAIHVDRNTPEPKAKGHGSEFLNHHLPAFLRTHHPDVRPARSRPYRKNDNNHIEQKNGSVVRALFGDLRFDDHAQLAPSPPSATNGASCTTSSSPAVAK